jgi:hypothetical protein
MGKSRAGTGAQKPRSGSQSRAVKQPEKPHRRKLVWLGTAGTVGLTVLTGVLVSVLSTQAQRVVPPPSSTQAPSTQAPSTQAPPGLASGTPHLEVDGVNLTSGGLNTAEKVLPFKIDIKLLNTGNGVAAINDARLVIQKFAVIPQCGSQGNFESTGTYSSNMPINPKPGQVVDIPISQIVPSNGADRFDLLLHAPLMKVKGLNVYLYRVHLYLTYNVHTKPLDVGEVLVNLPIVPDGGEYYWDSNHAAHPEFISNVVYAPEIPKYKRCVINNSNTLRSILSLSAMRPAPIAAILPQLRYSI